MASSLLCSLYTDPFSLLQTCSNPKHLAQIHAKFIRLNLSQNPLLATNLLRLYSSYANIDYATSIFHQIHNPSTFTWNLIIRAHTINGSSHKSLILYTNMLCSGVTPDKFTFPFAIKACGASKFIDMGKSVHAHVVKSGYYGKDMFVRNTLLDMYLKFGDQGSAHQVFDEISVRNVVSWTTMVSGLVECGELDAARKVFDAMPVRNVVSWTAMINGYVVNQRCHEAFELFYEMQVAGVKPNEFTLVCLLRACADLESVKLGAWVHDYALKNGFELGAYLGTALVDMYSKCGSLENARKVFNMMQKRSLATWNSMITSLGVHGFGEEALALFEQMLLEDVIPDAITFIGVLSACVQTKNVNEGLRWFKYMIEYCGILPVLEHYICMFELWGRANMIADASSQGGQSSILMTDTAIMEESISIK